MNVRVRSDFSETVSRYNVADPNEITGCENLAQQLIVPRSMWPACRGARRIPDYWLAIQRGQGRRSQPERERHVRIRRHGYRITPVEPDNLAATDQHSRKRQQRC